MLKQSLLTAVFTAVVGCALSAPTDTLSVDLPEVTVVSTLLDRRYSPLRIATVGREQIERTSTGITFPELLGSVSGVYATSESGNYGDARLNVRGFKQENISVMLNGIPISGLTSSSMYWNNWLGLTDATEAIELQKGVGSSMLADNSVGGIVNIITRHPRSSGGRVLLSATDYGLFKAGVSLSQAANARGWSTAVSASYTWGNNYVDATPVSAVAYMVDIEKRIDNRNTLSFTALGSPERHGQRSARLTSAEVEKYGVRYNKGWGIRDGKKYSVNQNSYFKPYFTLSHIYSADRFTLTSSAYAAIASGYGRWNESTVGSVYNFTGLDGQIDWSAIESLNAASESGSKFIVSNYSAGHTQWGALCKAQFKLTEPLTLDAGVHYQHYATSERETVVDLLGGDYWLDNWGDSPFKTVGDAIRTSNGKTVHHTTLYLSARYNSGRWTLTGGVSALSAQARRWDRYLYTGSDINGSWATGTGVTAKAGALFRATERDTYYANAAFYSRIPSTGAWFSSGSNAVNHNIRNEHNTLFEAGYRRLFERGQLEATLYCARWDDKTLLSNRYKPESGDSYKFMVTGLDALHCGLEVDVLWRPIDWLDLSVSASLARWRWLNDVEAVIYDDYTDQPVASLNVYCRNLPVGDAPQRQVSLNGVVKITSQLRFAVGVEYRGAMYADFDPITRTDSSDRSLPYRIADAAPVNCSVGWRWLTVGVRNLFDSRYVERGKDGSDHTIDTFTGYWAFGRNVNVTLNFDF